MKILLVTGILAMLVGFQNCAPSKIILAAVVAHAAQATVAHAAQATVAQAAQVTVAQPAYAASGSARNKVAVKIPEMEVRETETAEASLECSPAGTKLFASSAFINYRKCDGGLERWAELGRHHCCSGEVTIVDVENYEDAQCAEGRFAGVAYCE